MGEFQQIVERLAELLEKLSLDRKIDADELPSLAAEVSGRGGGMTGVMVNCYPGQLDDNCYDVAFFISLSSPKYRASRDGKHYPFEKIWQAFVQHMQGHCPGITRQAVIISDTWDAGIEVEWKANINQVMKIANVEGYLITADSVRRVL